MAKKISLSFLFILGSSCMYGMHEGQLFNTTNKDIIIRVPDRFKSKEYTIVPGKFDTVRKPGYRDLHNVYISLKDGQEIEVQKQSLRTNILIAEEDPTVPSGLKLSMISEEDLKKHRQEFYEGTWIALDEALPFFSKDLCREVAKYIFGDELLGAHEKFKRGDRAALKFPLFIVPTSAQIPAAVLQQQQEALPAPAAAPALAPPVPQLAPTVISAQSETVNGVPIREYYNQLNHSHGRKLPTNTLLNQARVDDEVMALEPLPEFIEIIPAQPVPVAAAAPVLIPPALMPPMPVAVPAPVVIPVLAVQPAPVPLPAVNNVVHNQRSWWKRYALYSGAAVAVIGSLVVAKKLFDWCYPRTVRG